MLASPMMPLLSIVFFLIIIVPSLTIHEYAHARASTRLGDVTPKLHGRLTLNPLAHIDPVGTVLVPVLLSLAGAGVIGRAKPVPINPYAYRKPTYHEFLVAMAGPLSNIFLGMIIVIVMVILVTRSGGSSIVLTHPGSTLMSRLQMAALTNFMLAFFNLLPVPPLDGYRIITLIAPSTKSWITRYQQYIMYGLLIVMISPLGGYIVTGIMRLSQALYGLIIMLLAGL